MIMEIRYVSKAYICISIFWELSNFWELGNF